MDASTESASSRHAKSDFELLVSYGRRNLWVILACVLAAIVAALLYIALAKPAYRATAVLIIQPQSSQPDTREAAPATPELVRSQLEVLKSQRVLDAAIRKLNLTRDAEFTEDVPAGARETARIAAAREALSDLLTVENDGRSYTISVTAKSVDPDKAARIANAVATAYIDAQREQKVRLIEATQGTLGRRLADLRSETFAAEQAAESYRQRVGLVPLSSVPEDSESYAASTPASREIIEMSKEHAALAARRAQARARFAAQQGALARGRGDSTSEVLSSSVISSLRTQEAELATRESELLARYRGDHPLVRPVQAELSQVRRSIAAETARIHRSVAADAAASDRALQSGSAFMDTLAAERSGDLAASTRLTQLQREARLKRQTYEEFAAQMQRASERASLQLPDVLLISPASAPIKATSPSRTMILLGAMVFGLIIGLLIGMVRSMMAGRTVVVDEQRISARPA